jgi:hypothetical protein
MVLEGLAHSLDDAFSLTVPMPERGEDYNLKTVQRALAGNLAGLILATPGTQFLETFIPTCPTVVLDAGGTAGPMPSVDLGLGQAVRDLAEYLASLGHHRVAYIGVARERKASLQHRREELQAGLLGCGTGLAVDDLMLEGHLLVDPARVQGGRVAGREDPHELDPRVVAQRRDVVPRPGEDQRRLRALARLDQLGCHRRGRRGRGRRVLGGGADLAGRAARPGYR